MGNDQYATKQDIAELREELKAMEERFQESLHDMETKLLRAFYTFAESYQKHLADLSHG